MTRSSELTGLCRGPTDGPRKILGCADVQDGTRKVMEVKPLPLSKRFREHIGTKIESGRVDPVKPALAGS